MKNVYSYPFKSVLIFYFGLLSIFLQAQNYVANFSEANNRSGYTDNVSFTIDGKPWFASARYHSGNDFRLGKDSRVNVPEKFMTTTTQGASVEMEWDIAYPKTISLATSTSYGTPRVWWIYESTDQGTSWQLVNTQDYIANSEWFTINVTPKPLARYAFVITGVSNPRVRLNQIKIEVEEPTLQVPELNQNARLMQGNYGEPINFPLRYYHYPTNIDVLGLDNLGLNYNPHKQTIEGTPIVIGEFPIQVQASNAYGISSVENILLRSDKGNQTLANLSDLTLSYNLQLYTLPQLTDQEQLITYTSSNLSIATITDNTIHFTDVGTFNLILTAPGNEYYLPFSKTISVRINKGTQSLATDFNDIIDYTGNTLNLEQTHTLQGQSLQYSTVNTSIATLVGNQLYLLNPGRTTLRIEAAATTTYNAFVREVMIEAVSSTTCYFENFSSKVLPINWTGSGVNFTNAYLNFNSNNGNVIFPAPASAKTLIFDLERTETTAQRVLNVLVSNDGISFQTIASYTPDNTILQQNISIDLSLYENVNWIKFEKVSGTTAQWRIDNLKIECELPRETTIWENSTWSNGLPALDKIVFIHEPLEWNSNTLEAYALTISTTGQLTVKSGSGLHIQTSITNEGQAHQFLIEDGAFVMQNDEVTNTGEAMVYKYSRTMYRNDMTIWSSPVKGQYIRAFSPETLYYRIWDYDESTTNYRPLFASADDADFTFVPGKGVAIRVRNTLPTNMVEEKLGLFQGLLNNGSYNVFTTKDDWGFNLIGNPYPSPIALDGPNGFFAQNPNVTQIFLWTPFYRTTDENFGNNYITISRAGAVGPYPDNPRTIAPGQGFFVQVNAPTLIYFNNAMRIGDSSVFYRSSVSDKNQFYLKLLKNNQVVNRQLIRYADETTIGFDDQWDALSIETGTTKSYSLLDDKYYSIQARGEFSNEDKVKIGYQTSSAEEMILQVDDAEGIFSSEQEIYLHDKVLGVIHPISITPYVFHSDVGIFNNRFEILYQPSTLQLNEEVKKRILSYTNGNTLVVHSPSAPIERWKVTTSDGRVVAQEEKFQQNKLRITLPKGIYVFSVNVNGQNIHQKFIIY